MKLSLLICLILGSVFSCCTHAQTPLTGAWEGKLAAAGNLRLILHLSPAEGDSLIASMDSPDQGATGIAATKAYRQGDSVFVFWAPMKASFTGAVRDTALTGTWQQGGARLPLTLHTTEKPTELLRPQTPQPPFPYKSEELTFQNPAKSITYGATLTIPEGKGPFPAVLLLTGSGPQNRDEEIFGHKPFAVLADFLTRRGFVVLRADDRGVGQTTGNAQDATQKDLLADATAAFEFLKARPEVNKQKLGILGHSQGGMTAQIMGAERKDVAFLMLMAAPGINGVEMMSLQNEQVLRAMGRKDEDARQYAALYRRMAQALLNSKGRKEARQQLEVIVTEWRKGKDQKTIMATTGMHDSSTQVAFVSAFAAIAADQGMLDLYRYDPAPYLKKIKAKVLALNGSKDIQVVSKPNLAGMESALSRGVSKGYEVKELSGLNHLFQKCSACTVQEYGQLEETLNPALLEAIGYWLAANIK